MGFYSSHQGSDDSHVPRDRKTEDVDSVSAGAYSTQSNDDFLADGSKDYKGQIAKRSTTGGWRTAPLIFGPETCEKMAVVGVVINFVPYLKGSLHLSSSYSANLVTTYQGTSYMLTLVGGFIADTRLGRYTVIVGAATVQFTGLLLLTLSASLPALKPKPCVNTSSHTCPAQTGTPLVVIYISVYLIAIGTGGIKACASAFGADQFDPKHETERKNLAGFFSWYFFGISLGACVATTGLVWIQDNEGRNWGYLVPAVAMLVVAVAFVSGRRLYRFKESKGSPLTQILQVFVAAHRKRRLQLPPASAGSDELYELDEGSRPYDYVRMERSRQYRFLDKAAIVVDPGRNAKLGEKPCNETSNKFNSTSLWRLNTVTRVEETKMVIRLMPILLTTSLFYTVYAQSTTFSVEQGSTMDRRLGNRFEISAASMAAFAQGSILLTLYLWEKAVVPVARRFTGHEKGTTSLQRIGVGLVVSVITMSAAAVVERRRMRYVKAEGLEWRLETDPGAHVSLSVFWLLPQYVLSGAGEALTYAGQLDFFYNESPRAMRSMGSALCVCTLSLGYYTSSFLVSVVNKATGRNGPDGSRPGSWLPDNIGTSGSLDKFYWLLAVASIGNFLFFLACAHWYRYKTEAPIETELKGGTRDVEICIGSNPPDRRRAQDS